MDRDVGASETFNRDAAGEAAAGEAAVRQTARGDHHAFGRIVEAHQRRIFAYLGRMGIDRATAEDIAQDTFLRVWRNAGQFNPKRGNLTTWILTIARNLASTRLSRPERRDEGLGPEAADEVVSDLPLPDAELLAAQRRMRLHRALGRLLPADRALLAASYFDDLDVADIARIEGCSAGAAKVRLHRARVRLRQILENDDA